jgi:nitric oxide reductase activation protein
MRVERLVAERGQFDGDALDLDAAIAATVDHRARLTPDGRVYVRTRRREGPFAILGLLDQSRSTEAVVPRAASTVLELAAAACIELGELLSSRDRPFAVHGFSSNGRHEVDYRRYKDFGDPWNDATRARIASVRPLLSTRMGAALRHAGRCLRAAPEHRRLVLLLTDGEPADIDAPDPEYLLHDARHAVADLRRQGVDVYAVGLGTAGEAPLRRIFGAHRFQILDRLERLPELLPRLCARLAH